MFVNIYSLPVPFFYTAPYRSSGVSITSCCLYFFPKYDLFPQINLYIKLSLLFTTGEYIASFSIQKLYTHIIDAHRVTYIL